MPKTNGINKKISGMQKLALLWEFHKWKIIIGGFVVLAIAVPFWGFGLVDSYYQRISLMSLSLMPIQALIHGAIFVGLWAWLLYGGGRFGSKLKKSRIQAQRVNVKWDDVIGLEAAKQEAKEIVDLVQDHVKLQQLGGKAMRGLLLMGPPGCGKTYLAKAIATEASLPFLSVSGSEFVEVFVGTGPARVRSIFKNARQLARLHGGCILFIDELDAVGTARTTDLGFGGQSERNNTVNQMLIEMDGLNDEKGQILVVGATNANESVLDSALMRPGRFDRKIFVDRPGLEEREALFKFYLAKVQHEADINVSRLARRAVWKTPAEIENIVKESVLIAARNKRDAIGSKDISDALERQELGFKRQRKLSLEERKRIAYHEAGHVIATYLLHPTDDVFKASIVSRKEALGVVYHHPQQDLELYSSERILADIKAALGGFVAEKLKCNGTSDGVAADFQHATMRAHQMVWRLGMGTNGFIGDFELLTGSWAFRQNATGDRLSDRMKDRLNLETQEILKKCLVEVENLLKTEDALLEKLAEQLLIKEELDYDEIEGIFTQSGRQHKRLLEKPAPAITQA